MGHSFESGYDSPAGKWRSLGSIRAASASPHARAGWIAARHARPGGEDRKPARAQFGPNDQHGLGVDEGARYRRDCPVKK